MAQVRAELDRSAAIDGLRFVAVLAVCVIHVAGVADDASRPLLFELLIGVCDWSIAALFVLSGFVTASRGHTARTVVRW